ncbi:unnamed protein product [Oikopleura dioica]|uniref:Uncharacterized protein n=1 Tax=Oikopleura dioica TaxID=34765 RepID=E4YT53_OIKDI|nr:unnamed protein product [Oikopleura dioica]
MGKSKRSNKTAPEGLVVDVIHSSDPRLQQPVPESDDEPRTRKKQENKKVEKVGQEGEKRKKRKVAEEEPQQQQTAVNEEREQPKRKVSFEDGTAQVFDSAVAPEKIHDGPTEEAPIPPETPVPDETQNAAENQVIAEETTEISPIIEVTPDSTSGEGQLTEEATTAAETEASEPEEVQNDADESDVDDNNEKPNKRKSMAKKWPKLKKPKSGAETDDEGEQTKKGKKGKKTKKEIKAAKAAKKAEAAKKKKELHNLVDKVAASYSNSILDLRNSVKELKDEHKESERMELAKHHLGFLQTTVTRLDNINDDLKICDKIVDETTPSLLETFRTCREFLSATELALNENFESKAEPLKTKVHELDEHTKMIKGRFQICLKKNKFYSNLNS